MSVLHFVPLAVIIYILSIVGLSSANKTKSCDITGCKEDETCRLGKCIKSLNDYDECFSTPCTSGYYCDEHGKCIKDTPCDLPCKKGEECYLQPVACFVAPCPPIPSCRPDKCASVKCPDGEICENGKCVLDSKCAATLCLSGTYCYKGSCLQKVTCEEGQCGTAELCYVGSEACSDPPCPTKLVCRFDRCAVIRCRSGYKCEDGGCVKT